MHDVHISCIRSAVQRNMDVILMIQTHFMSDELYLGSRIKFYSLGENLSFSSHTLYVYSCCVYKYVSFHKISLLLNYILSV
jgi:hypothetical protein